MSFDLSSYLSRIVADDALHCRWLNTLSMMENIGATKIVKGAHPFHVSETQLKHAAEETRHAYYLKRQINKITDGACPTFEPQYLINPRQSYQYMHLLDVRISKALGEALGVSGAELRNYAYTLVTYAVEVRADDMYETYQAQLKAHNSPVSVRGIIAEEEQHLAEMNAEMDAMFGADAQLWKDKVVAIENELYDRWVSGFSAAMDDIAKAA